MAQLHARGELALDEPFVNESVIGTRFTGRARRGDDRRRAARGHPRDHRPRLDHRDGPVPARRRGPVPGGFAWTDADLFSGCQARTRQRASTIGTLPGMPPRDDEVQALVEQLSAELDRSVLVDDASLRLLAYSPTLGSRGRGPPDRDPDARDPARHPRPALRAGHRQRDPAGAHRAAAGHRAGVARVRPDPLPGRAVRLPVADRRRPVADRRRLRRRRSAARPRSAPRCTAATSSRSRSASTSCGCWRRCSAPTPAQREAAAHELAGRRPAGRRRRHRRARDAPVARPRVRARRRPSARGSGLALDQFRRALPRRQALSVVARRPRPDARLVDAHVAARRRPRRARPRAQEALDQAFAGDGPTRIALGYSESARAPARRPPRPRARPARAAGRRRAARARHARRLGRARRLPAAGARRRDAARARADPSRAAEAVRAPEQGVARRRRSRPTSTTAATPSSRPRRCSCTARASTTACSASRRSPGRRSRAARTGWRCIPGSSSRAWSAYIRR